MSEEAVSVLVVDDDPGVREFLNDYLSEHGFEVLQAESGNAMRAMLAERVPDVVLLDVRLPGEDGLSLARYVREHFDIGIIMVSGAGETVDRIVGLEVGGDDYVTKPFDPRELRTRLKTVLRRYRRPFATHEPALAAPAEPAAATRRVTFGRSLLDLDSHQLFDTGGEEIPITSMEFDLLKVFAERPNRPLSRDQLLNLTRNRDWDPLDRSIDIHIARLRRKVEPDPDRPRSIKTVRGVGYMYVPQSR
jgi:DNA-binding response OmpR family regulator